MNESLGEPRVKREVNIKADKLHNEELRNCFSSPDIIRKIKSRTMHGQGIQRTWERSGYNVLIE